MYKILCGLYSNVPWYFTSCTQIQWEIRDWLWTMQNDVNAFSKMKKNHLIEEKYHHSNWSFFIVWESIEIIIWNSQVNKILHHCEGIISVSKISTGKISLSYEHWTFQFWHLKVTFTKSFNFSHTQLPHF